MMLLCENEKLPHAYSDDTCSMCSLKKPKRISLFNGQMDTLLKLLKTTLNESYNLPPYILAASSDNKNKASTNFSLIQRENDCQNFSSNFISKGSLLLE